MLVSRLVARLFTLALALPVVCAAAPFAYVTNYRTSDVSVVDTASNAVVATVPVTGLPVGVAVNQTATRVYVANSMQSNGVSYVSVIDTATNAVVANVAMAIKAYGIAVNPAGTRVYVTNMAQGSTSITVLDATTNSVIGTVSVGVAPIAVAVNPAGTRVFVVNSGGNSVSVIDAGTNAGLGTVNVGNGPVGISINAAGTRAYVANQIDNTVSVIDASTLKNIATVPVGVSPIGIAVNPAGTLVYAVNQVSHDVSIIDATTNAVVGAVNVVSNPRGISFTPDGARAYVANYSTNNVSVIDTATRSVVATIAVGMGPYALGQFIVPPAGGSTSPPPDATPPSVAITSPTGGNVSGTVTVTANASDNVGVSRVDFYVNGALAGTSSSVPWQFAWNTSALANGSATARAKAYDAAGNMGQSALVTVNVANTVAPAPSTTGIASSANPVAAGTPVVLTASVTGVAPTGTVTFTDGGVAIAGCTGVALTGGSGNIRTATCTTSALAAGTHTIVGLYSGDASNGASASPALSLVVTSSGSNAINVALAANGGVATASSVYGAAFPVAAINDGDYAQFKWGGGGGWNDATINGFPDWVQIGFNGTKSVDRVVLYTLSNVYWTEGTPSDTETFSQNGIVDFSVQAWNGSSWVTVATVAGNNLVKRTVTFPTVTTDRIRVNVTSALGGYSRIVELEAWGTAVANSSVNVALAANGGVASASSFIGSGFPVAALNDGVRTGATWGSGGGWNDATINAFPDWAQVAFSGFKMVDRVVVYTLSDAYWLGGEPSDILTFSSFGIVDFSVQAWNGTSWITVATVTGNNLVKRTVTFAPQSADRVRINVTNAFAGYTRIVEIEAWGK